MRVIVLIVKALVWPFARIVSALRALPRSRDEIRDTLVVAGDATAAGRTVAAPLWRRLIRAVIIAAGFVLFSAIQVGTAYMILEPRMWWMIVAALIALVALVLAICRPTVAYYFWILLSVVGFVLFRFDLGKGLPAVSFDRVVMFFLSVILVGKLLVSRQPVRRMITAEWMSLAFIAYSAVAVTLVSYTDILGLLTDKFDYMGLTLIIYFVTKACLTERRHLAVVLGILVIVGVYSAGFGIFEHYTGNAWFTTIFGGGAKLNYQDIEKGRASGPLLNPSAYGGFLGIAVFVAFHLSNWTRSRFMKIALYVAAIEMTVGMYFCYTRGGYITWIVMMALMPFAAGKGRRPYVVAAVAVALLGLVTLPRLLSEQGFSKRMLTTSTIYARMVVNATMMNMVRHNAWFGVGLGRIDAEMPNYITGVAGAPGMSIYSYFPNERRLKQAVTSHNSLLTIFAEQGIVGGSLYVGALVAFAVYLARLRRKLPVKGILGTDYVSFVLVALVAHIASISTYDVRFLRFPTYVVYILIAIGVRLSEIVHAEERADSKAVEPSRYAGPLSHGLRAENA